MSEAEQRCPYCAYVVPAGMNSSREMYLHFSKKHKKKQ